MRKILLAAAALVVIGAAVGASVYYFTKGVADTASAFFATIASTGPEVAYRSASPAFQQAMSESSFTALVNRAGLTRFKSASWPERAVENGQGSVSGTLMLDGDVSLPAKVQLIKNAAGAWKVFNFTLQMPGGAQQGEPQPRPASGDQVSALIGDRAWSADGLSLVVLKLGNTVLVNTAPVVKPDSTIDATSLRLQFDAKTTGAQKLTRNCQKNEPCIELSANDSHYKIDESPNAAAILTITKMDAGRIEGEFSADMISLEGKLAIHQGRFVVSVK
ncbi:hypothetical protein C5L14_12240 [Labrys okinawensis]|uniref:Uncharacterized protein n=2 Tax=Labrys okinawensis TaxID=346911 RepID=A0A2S9QDG5_9HYPH|nr:hypothetical protein C5L14_12240 [Labrys okinawensis]